MKKCKNGKVKYRAEKMPIEQECIFLVMIHQLICWICSRMFARFAVSFMRGITPNASRLLTALW
jgi:hypothetical protein